MKKYLLASLFSFYFLTIFKCESQSFEIVGEGFENKSKMIWHTKEWHNKLVGFNLKRSIDGNEFVQLNESVIKIDNYKGKNLENVLTNHEDLDFFSFLMDSIYNAGILLESTYEEVHEYANQDLIIINFCTYNYQF
jgi:hypothetical protein